MMVQMPYLESYVQFPTGRMTLTQIQQIFTTIPFEIDLIDHTDHFSWYSNQPQREHVRTQKDLGEHVQKCHPAKAWPIVAKIIQSFKDGSRDAVARPLVMNGHRVFIQYFALRDVNGDYLGTIEFTGSAEPILQALENGGWSDASSGASKADGKTGVPAVTDADTGASTHPETGAVADAGTSQTDAYSGASQSDSTGPFSDSGQATDAMTGASEY